MNFLSIESVTDNPSIALYIDDICVSSRFMNSNSSELASEIKGIILDNKIDINTLDYIAITIGPGSYTGVRVGLSLAQGLAYSLNIPLLPIHTMDILYSLASQDNHINKLVGFPAYKDKVLHFTITQIKHDKKYNLKLSKIQDLEGEAIYGVGLDKYKDVVDYKKINFSAESIGEYSIVNYKLLCCDDIGNIAPIYLDEFLVS